METIIRNVEEIDMRDRQSLEHVLGRSLSENEQLVINIVNLENTGRPAPTEIGDALKANRTLPEWCNVYEGLSDNDLESLEQTILQRADMSRASE